MFAGKALPYGRVSDYTTTFSHTLSDDGHQSLPIHSRFEHALQNIEVSMARIQTAGRLQYFHRLVEVPQLDTHITKTHMGSEVAGIARDDLPELFLRF